MPSFEAATGAINVSQTRHFSEVKQGYTSFQSGDVLLAKITPGMENGIMAVVPKLVAVMMGRQKSVHFEGCVSNKWA